ncbi:MAG: hypothetical protein DLM68_04220 [Hyphomicrobiales bacterium]|nr:MAG: hypothetical protein DLM68_04220 [Hyphomicrobiales bacterium]
MPVNYPIEGARLSFVWRKVMSEASDDRIARMLGPILLQSARLEEYFSRLIAVLTTSVFFQAASLETLCPLRAARSAACKNEGWPTNRPEPHAWVWGDRMAQRQTGTRRLFAQSLQGDLRPLW